MSAIFQVWLPSVLIGLLNVAVAAAAAPVLDELRRIAGRAAVAGAWHAPAMLIDRDRRMGWRELSWLNTRPCLRMDRVGVIGNGAPAASLALSLAVLPLVPGPATWFGLSRIADLPTLVALLAVARAVTLLGVMEGGDSGSILQAQAGLLDMARGAFAMAFAFLSLAIITGETGTEHVLGILRGPLLVHGGAPNLLCGAVVAAACTAEVEVADGGWSGSDLAMCRYAMMLRRVAWIELLSALLAPVAVATPDTGGMGWLLALGGWIVRLVMGSVLLGTGQQVVVRFGLRHAMFKSSLLLSILAVLAAAPLTGASE